MKERKTEMSRQIQKLAAGALCALILTAVAVAPAHAHRIAAGRAGQIRNVEITGGEAAAQKIAEEFVGLIHVVSYDHDQGKLFWTLQTRDGRQVLLHAEAAIDEAGEAIFSQGEINQGALQGAKVYAMGYQDGPSYMVNLEVSLGDTWVAFTQTLEPLTA
jgi:hypothetical protein